MNNNIKLIVYAVSDLAAAKKLFGVFLNVQPYVDSAYYVGYKAGELEVGLTPKSPSQNASPPVVYTDTDDIRTSMKMLSDAGATVVQEPKDVGGGMTVVMVKDNDGNIFGLRQKSL